ncbi:MAG: divalent cation tolerance protein CutA [Verrucomicrobiae bacterium]|nr:divalent cation tolerance protein CutA [Verrucomicrobiae bacterium]
MEEPYPYRWAITTYPASHRPQAVQFIQLALTQRLVACAHLIPHIESHFTWENKITSTEEILITLKTTQKLAHTLYDLLTRHHPYTCPQWLLLTPHEISPSFQQWWLSSLTPPPQ